MIFYEKRRLFFIILWAAQTLCNSILMPKVRAQIKVPLAQSVYVLLWGRIKAQSASLLSNWPELLPCRHSLRGIWRHFTEAQLQISYFSIQCIPLLNIKTYGSHYLHIGCKGWSGQTKKKSGHITNLIFRKENQTFCKKRWGAIGVDLVEMSIIGRLSHLCPRGWEDWTPFWLISSWQRLN